VKNRMYLGVTTIYCSLVGVVCGQVSEEDVGGPAA
jgi:hypothetical protein